MRSRLRLIKKSPATLLGRAQEDPDAFGAFYDAYSDRVLAFLARRVLDPEVALDLLSETFAKALERRGQFRGQNAEQEQGWLFSIARTELLRYWRAGQVERAAMLRFAVTVPALSDAEHDRIEALADLSGLEGPLLAALSALPDDQRRAVELRVLRELSYPELAAELGVAEPTARARVSRGLRTLALAVPRPTHGSLVGDIA